MSGDARNSVLLWKYQLHWQMDCSRNTSIHWACQSHQIILQFSLDLLMKSVINWVTFGLTSLVAELIREIGAFCQ